MAEPQGQEGPSQALLREPVPHSELDERWGPESVGHITLLNKVAVDTEKTTQEERDEHFRVMREEIIPLLNRCEAVLPMERKEAFAVFEKYHAQGTGVRDTLVKEYDTLLKDLDARMPLLAKALRAAHPKRPLNNDQIVSFENDNEAPFVIFNNTGYANAVAVQLEHHRATRALLFKKVALMKNQNDALTRALVKNGIQLPHECATIQEQLQALKDFSPDESAPGNTGRDVTSELPSEAANPEETGSEIEQRRDPLPGHKLVTLSEDPSGSGTTGYWQCSTDSPVVEEEAVAREMNGAELQDLLQSLHRYNCGQYFEKPLTEEESPEYFDVVKDHRDLSTIKDDLGKDPEYSACEFFFDLRLMIDNYSHVFGEGSEERRMVNLFQEVMLKKLEGYGEAGQIAKAHFDHAPRAEFNKITPPSEADETILPSEADDRTENPVVDDFETSFAFGLNKAYEADYGDQQNDSFAVEGQDILDYDDDGNDITYEQGPSTQSPGAFGTAQHPGSQYGHVNQSPSIHGPADQSGGEFNLDRAWMLFDTAKKYDQKHGNATRAPAGRGTAQPRDDADRRESPSRAASRPAEQADDEAAQSRERASEQPAAVANKDAEQAVIDPTASPQRQASPAEPASAKRARASDDQDSFSDDDVSPIKRQKTTAASSSFEEPVSTKRQETAAESSPYAVTPSLGKRSRDDGDGDGESERQKSPKRQKASSSSVPEPLAPVATAAGKGGSDSTSLTIDELFEPFESSPRPGQEPTTPAAAAAQGDEPDIASYQRRLRVVQNALDHASPLVEPLTPVVAAADGPGSVSPLSGLPESPEMPGPANNDSDMEGHESEQGISSPSAAVDEPQPEPATEALGHTNNGTTTASKLHKLPKYKRKGRSKGGDRPNRPWVFGYRFGDEYGLYTMGCPTKGCETGTQVFKTHPLMHNDAANHLRGCGHEFADDDEMVRKFGTQVISDGKKTVSIDWARNWNNELMKEYGDEDRQNENF